MKLKLNRLGNFIKINKETPLDVILYLLNTSGKQISKDKIDKKFDKIKSFLEDYGEFLEIKDEYPQEELHKISSFLSNSEEPWTLEILLKSFRNLVNFYKNFTFPDVKKITFGERTNTSPESYDIVMAYIVCLKLKIKTTRDDTILTLKEKLLEVENNRMNFFSNIKQNLNNLNSLQLYHMSSNLPEEENKFSLKNTDELSSLSKNINLNYIIKNSILTNEEAIVYCGKFFNYDISESSYPVDTLLSIINKKEDTIEFNKVDNFSKRFSINPKFFRLDKFWKKNIGFLYSGKTLTVLKNYENLDEEQNLDSKLDENNFYDGVVDFKNAPEISKHIITYGCINDDNLETITPEDLEKKFSENLSFGNYDKNIEKLVNICRDYKNNDSYSKLHKTVRYVQKFCKPLDGNIKEIMECNRESKLSIKKFFEKIYEISEILKGKSKINDLDNVSLINIITDTLNFIDRIKDEDMKTKLLKLKFVNYKDDIFVKNSENYYSNMVEDLRNLKNLKEKSEEYLLNKNKTFSESSYYYTYLFYKEHVFDINNY